MLAADAHLQRRSGGPPRSVPSRTSSPTPSASTTSKGFRGEEPQLQVGPHHPPLDVVAG